MPETSNRASLPASHTARPSQPITAAPPSMIVEAELACPLLSARIVRFDIPAPTEAMIREDHAYHINMCLTPRPLNARASYPHHWGPHRFERMGDIFMVPPGEELYIKGESGRQASLLCNIHPEAISSVIGADLVWTDRKLAATIAISNARIRALLFRMAEEARHPGLAAPRMLEFLGGEIAIEIARFCQGVDERPITGGLAGWRLRLIDERLAESPVAPTLAELAHLCNLSVRQLTRGFKVSRQCSIGDYMDQRRMEAAKRMLVAGESVKTIAFAMGFASPSSFTFAFRRAVGASPSTFRQRQTRVLRQD